MGTSKIAGKSFGGSCRGPACGSGGSEGISDMG